MPFSKKRFETFISDHVPLQLGIINHLHFKKSDKSCYLQHEKFYLRKIPENLADNYNPEKRNM